MTPVTKTFFPPLDDYSKQLQRVWNNEWLTNRGELVKELEKLIISSLGTSKMFLTTNGTIPLQIALKILGNQGEIITTPFSYVATTSTIVWENCTPVFVDIDPQHLTIDETKIEKAITEKTTAILATHVFGNPCNVEEIERIAKIYGLKVIYDAAHCFGVNYNGQSLFNYGDLSTCSFHATKVFHTGEGGAIFSNDESIYNKAFYSHNFGHNGPNDFDGVGINGKMSELQAAMGLTMLPYMDHIFQKRKDVVKFYNSNIEFTKLGRMKIREGTSWNFSYYPVLFKNESDLIEKVKLLNENNIFPRRYFYPSLNTLKYINSPFKMPVAEEISKRILCLPLFVNINLKSLECIVKILNKKLC